jgi:peptide/nickel transport system substrate-binding protein
VFTANYGQFEDPDEVALYQKMLRETDPDRQRALMRHRHRVAWWYRAVPYRSYVKGWKISPSHFINQDLSMVWLDR